MKASSQLETLLGISLPEDYRGFIDKTGYLGLGNISTEVYGYQSDFDIEKIPCVIAATKLNKEDYKLKSHEIVISHTGFEDYIVVLDTISGSVFELNLVGDKTKLADSFSSWLAVMQSKNRASEQ
jgi:hypothetical protein